MKSSGGSSSNQLSIHHTSTTSLTQSAAPSQPSTNRAFIQVTVGAVDRHKHFTVADWLPAVPTVVVGIMSVLIVDRLTRGRDREKTALDLYQSVGEQLGGLKDATFKVWTLRRGAERQRAVEEALWRLQQIGATVNRLHILTQRHRPQAKKPFWADVSVQMRAEMVTLRRAITSDQFDDGNRRADATQNAGVERAIGTFQNQLDQKLTNWMARAPKTKSGKTGQ
jgi:hypothetical protein